VSVLAWDDTGLLAETVKTAAVPPTEFAAPATTSLDAAASVLRGWVDSLDLLITATRNAPAKLFRAINHICLRARCPWLHANESAHQIEIGPYIRPHESACFTCMEQRRASTEPLAIEEHLYQDQLAARHPAGSTPPLGESLVSATLGASIIIIEVIRILTFIAPPTLLGSTLHVSPLEYSFETNRVLRVPRCEDCYDPGASPS
jgi:bacteriocin biosynthesis cyclodehydratase domain-containing protein